MSYDGREPIFVTVDGVVSFYNKKEETNYILLIKRLKDPYKGQWAFPGGHLDADDTSLKSACEREVLEETGIDVYALHILDVKDEIGRDPRGRYINHPFMCYQNNRREMLTPRPRTDAKAAKWFPIHEVRKMDLAFDHNIILLDAFFNDEYYELIYPDP